MYSLLSLSNRWSRVTSVVVFITVFTFYGCSNNPYPEEKDSDENVYYSSFANPPRELDPQLAYSSFDLSILKHCYESLLDYDYMDRPLKLVPQLAKKVPEAIKVRDDNGDITSVKYKFDLRQGVTFIDDPCFATGKGREMTAYDFEYAFKRAADSRTNCPIFDSLCYIKGFKSYSAKIAAERKVMEDEWKKLNPDAEKAYISSEILYKGVGNLPGINVTGKYSFELILNKPYPQILYWLAMRFICAIPHEAVDYYDGSREVNTFEPMEFLQRPVGTGPYQFDWNEFNREAKMVLVKNKNWWGLSSTEKNNPITHFSLRPANGEDVSSEAWSRADAGRKLCMVDKIALYKEKEALPRFSKFVQGFYDSASIPREKMEELVGSGDSLSEDMVAKGIRMVKDYRMDIRYLCFNMDDDTIGSPVEFSAPDLEANRAEELGKRKKLRQAMSLAIDTQNYLDIFYKSSAIKAESILPPGIPGYDADYKNPYTQYDSSLALAKRLLSEAGYVNGIDPKTGKNLRLTFTAGGATASSRLMYNYFIDSWKKLGIDVVLDATDHNKFAEKVDKGSFQIFEWGWGADYPDPENFFFLLYGKNSKKYGTAKPNAMRFENERYDYLFKLMETMATGESAMVEVIDSKTGAVAKVSRTRGEIIKEMQRIIQENCPFIPTLHSVNFIIYHSWLKNVKPHPQAEAEYEYYRVDRKLRDVKRKEWNEPIVWPVFVMLLGGVVFLVPAILTIKKERR